MEGMVKEREVKTNNIREQRMKALSEGYKKPKMISFSYDSEVSGECSDMCSHACEPHKNCCQSFVY